MVAVGADSHNREAAQHTVKRAHTILQEISSLLAESESESGRGRPSLAAIENTLTAGYARALELEAERWRLERRIGQLAPRLDEQDAVPGAEELARLARRAARTDGELQRLRSLLATLRARASALRAAGATLTF
jgi:chromosome segregation ATPase